ncbi:hypothetical protein FQV39_32820 (plasmid) [Bosea sp. F3-2]|uniref:hypothetical protein n=1 Tax=Bosea sp. F3-2 TaxID=2599640 RepID=UPI0011ED49A0|nr:hypothetical protein [Bosea sp. F3-2]QEL27388.1 hypothetical protein FQV39_32820 [Bosea sp. F3-2]
MGDERRRESCNEDAYAILTRMLADAERLCATQDPLLTGQAAQLRGRIAAMVVVATPPSLLLAEARS